MKDTATAYGAFGKLPGLGDFFQFAAPAGFVQAWDDWLQRGMLSARERLGEGWQAAYTSAPIWRFTLSPGLAGPAAVTGILMCSVDRVGRQFPLTLIRAADAGQGAAATHMDMTAEFEVLETIALTAMEEETGRDALLAALGEVTPTPPGEGVTIAPSPQHLDLLCDPDAQTGRSLAAGLVARHYRAPSFWSAWTPEGLRILAYEGLPEASELAHLLAPAGAGETVAVMP